MHATSLCVLYGYANLVFFFFFLIKKIRNTYAKYSIIYRMSATPTFNLQNAGWVDAKNNAKLKKGKNETHLLGTQIYARNLPRPFPKPQPSPP